MVRLLGGDQFVPVPPVQFDHAVDAASCKPLLVTQRGDEQGRAMHLLREMPQRGLIHVVVMVVRQQHHVDVRQLCQVQTRRCLTLRSRPLHGKASLGKHRVREDVEPADLQQHRDVTDPRGSGLHGHTRLGIGMDEVQVRRHHGNGLVHRPRMPRAPGLPSPPQDFVPALASERLVVVLKAVRPMMLLGRVEVGVLHGEQRRGKTKPRQA